MVLLHKLQRLKIAYIIHFYYIENKTERIA